MSDGKDKNFINETVAKKKKSPKEVLKNSAFFCVEALAFGVIAALAFSWMEPRISKLIDNKKGDVITIDNHATTSEEEIKVSEDSVSDADSHETNRQPLYYTKEGMNKLLSSIVQIEGKIDVLDEKGKVVGEEFTFTSGAIISTGANTIILTDYESVKDSDILKVTFDNDTQCNASVISVDRQLGIAVISAKTEHKFDESYLPKKNIFGNSDDVAMGDELMYVGVSEGVGVINVDCEILTTDNILQYADVIYSMFTTDLASNVAKNGFLYNSNNQLVGMIAHPENNGIKDLVAALGTTDIRAIVEKMSNGKSLPYMGINGSTVTDELKEYVNPDMPYGVYVTRVDTNSPAYDVGILNGDIITEVAGIKIDSVKSFSNVLKNLNEGNAVEVNVKRYGKNEYKKLTFNVIIGGKDN